jgi:hypothetical protein
MEAQMHRWGNWRLRGGLGAFAGALVLSASGYAAAPASAAAYGPTGGVSPTAATGTPELTTPGPQETVHQLLQCGGTMYAVGNFTSITQDGVKHTRDNVFSFSATSPFTMTSWAPDVNGIVNTIAFAGPNCADAYIGGTFSKVNSTPVGNIAEISTTTGAVNNAFAHGANNEVATIVSTGTHLLVGGDFTSVNGVSGYSGAYYTSLNDVTGKYDHYLNLGISGKYRYPGSGGNITGVYNQQISHAGRRIMVEGVFTTVAHQHRQQAFQMWLSPKDGVVTDWTAPILNDYCGDTIPWYARAVAWAPSDVTVYFATTGVHLYNWHVGDYPLTGPCDALLSFSADESPQNPRWINYTGCDSFYSVAADDYAVYAAGHIRWADNPDDCNAAGRGAVADPGLQGHNPANGALELNSSGRPLYSMSKANGDDMLITGAGLWIASSNRFDFNECGGVHNVAGICFLPYN